MVMVNISAAPGTGGLYINGEFAGYASESWGGASVISSIIPNGNTYRLVNMDGGGVIITWWELR
jgi:hypothetical protein